MKPQYNQLYFEIKDCLDLLIMLGELKSTGVLCDLDPTIDEQVYKDITIKLTEKYKPLDIYVDYNDTTIFYDFNGDVN